jgi:lysophospholipid acyltransferase (LPLAT)-like uncharacterized protein
MTDLQWRLVGRLGAWLIHAIFSTIRIRFDGETPDRGRRGDGPGQYIAAIWHSRILMFSYLYKGWPASILVSRSDDGEIIARILQRQGFETIRGSTNKGGRRALGTLIRRMKAGGSAVIIPDGPQGPRFRVQPGIILLAQKTGVPIYPLSYSAKHAKIFASWDRFMLPRPFTQCAVVYGNPLSVPADADDAEREACRRRLEAELCRITLNADRHVGRITDGCDD